MSAVKHLALTILAATALAAQDRPNGLYAIFDTGAGKIVAKLYEKDVPTTVENFVALAQGTKPTFDANRKAVRKPLYNGITFHRVVPGEMIQSGDPTGTGTHNCGVRIPDEFMPGLRFDMGGKLAMANTGDPNSGGCQWFITVNAMMPWNGKYTVFGTVVEGRQVVEQINKGPVRGDRPVTPVKLNSVTIERVGPPPEIKKKRK